MTTGSSSDEMRGADPAGAGLMSPVDLDRAINRVDDGFIALDRDWQVRYLNVAAARQLGREVGDLIGRSIWEEFPTAVGSVFDLRYREALETQERIEFEEHVEPLNAWFSIRVYPSLEGVTLDLSGHHRLPSPHR